ncbi:Response_reg domain-containing protein/Myb_DNA-binding domain-containing protein, partial [Cephalotus follicularis]
MNNGKVESSKNAQSLTYDVRFLVVDGDSTCLTLASRMLRRRGYKVMTAKRAKDALCIIRDREDEIDLVLTESHLPDMDTYKLLETIGEVSSLPVIIMSSDNDENAMLGGLFKGAVFYLVKPIIMNDMKNLWQFAYMNYREKMADLEGINSFQEDSPDENSSDDKSEGQSLTKNGKRKEPEPGENDKDEEEDNDSGVTKKSKLIWTNELHNRFLQAVRVLGFDSAHPKKILEHMNVKGLKKENVSSHLQKYRLTLKRELDAIDITANRN